jgi:hypothetical protein
VQLALQQGTLPFFYMRNDIWGDADEPHSGMQLALQQGTAPFFIWAFFWYRRRTFKHRLNKKKRFFV